ncbi:hypothetical protein KEM52_003358 [Ascosphaera acerosa]|nr:hypothetical protein KEM52_003358 [Ascosphaera acerosa]
MSSTFTILYFAAAAAHTGRQADSLPAPLPLRELLGALEARYPGFAEQVLCACAVSVNMEYVDAHDAASEITIAAGDEVAIIPPVSSG